jgi:hypothetical protein
LLFTWVFILFGSGAAQLRITRTKHRRDKPHIGNYSLQLVRVVSRIFRKSMISQYQDFTCLVTKTSLR